MTRQAAPAEPRDQSVAAVREWHLQVLGELAEIGLDLARIIEVQSKRAGEDPEAAALASAQIMRSVRQTVLLQTRILKGL